MCAIIEKIQKEVPIMSTNENKGKKAEVTALQAISAEDRKDWISLAFVQAGICVCVPAFLLGALLAEAMPIWPAIISGSLGYLIVVVGMVATGMIGCDLGLASCTCCQAGFGKNCLRFHKGANCRALRAGSFARLPAIQPNRHKKRPGKFKLDKKSAPGLFRAF